MLLDSYGKEVPIEKLRNKKIIMYGSSTRNQAAIRELQIGENVLFLVDSDTEKEGLVQGGYQVYSVKELENHKDCIILSVLVYHSKEVLEALGVIGIHDCLFFYPELFDLSEVVTSNNIVIQRERHYRYIHVFSNDKFVIPFYQMLEERFCMEEHLIILAYRIKDDFAGVFPFAMEKNKEYHNILLLDDVHGILDNGFKDKTRLIPSRLECNQVFWSNRMKELCNYAEMIFLHSAFWGHETKKLMYDLTQIYHRKMIWGVFNGDAYFERDSFEVSQILSKIGKSSTSKAMVEVIKKNYGICAEADSNAYYVYIPNQIKCKKIPAHDSVNILLGHSAYENGNHIEGLKLLQKYADENIKIYCPLSYGLVTYSNFVIQEGKKIFGKKFIPILHYIRQEQYFQFLRTMDVAVFPLTRTAGESTFLLLEAASVKIYANMDAVGYMQNELIHVEDITKIRGQSFEEFAEPVRAQLYDIDGLNEYMVMEWKKFLKDEGKERNDSIQ